MGFPDSETVIADDEAGNALAHGVLAEYLQPLLPERTLQQVKPSSTQRSRNDGY
jgi:hypothetical protein